KSITYETTAAPSQADCKVFRPNYFTFRKLISCWIATVPRAERQAPGRFGLPGLAACGVRRRPLRGRLDAVFDARIRCRRVHRGNAAPVNRPVAQRIARLGQYQDR